MVDLGSLRAEEVKLGPGYAEADVQEGDNMRVAAIPRRAEASCDGQLAARDQVVKLCDSLR